MSADYLVVKETHEFGDTSWEVVPGLGVSRWEVVKDVYVRKLTDPLVSFVKAERTDEATTIVYQFQPIFGGDKITFKVWEPEVWFATEGQLIG